MLRVVVLAPRQAAGSAVELRMFGVPKHEAKIPSCAVPGLDRVNADGAHCTHQRLTRPASQMIATPQLHPKPDSSGTAHRGVILTNGEIDAVAGLCRARGFTLHALCA